MRENPMMAPVLALLHAHPEGLSEYEIISALKVQGLYIDAMDDPSMALYTGHFFVMNALYALQRELLSDGLYLHISPMENRLHPTQAGGHGALRSGAADAALSAYYLDWNNLDTMTPDGVEKLLSGFWEHFAATDRQPDALTVLGLEAGADWGEIQVAYRRLAAMHHPDRGGDAEQFIAVREAFLVLKGFYTG